jgi:hypothetical protein
MLFASIIAILVAVFCFDQAAFLMLAGVVQAYLGVVFILRRRVPVVGGAEFKGDILGLPAVLVGVVLLVGGAWYVVHAALSLSPETLALLPWPRLFDCVRASLRTDNQ